MLIRKHLGVRFGFEEIEVCSNLAEIYKIVSERYVGLVALFVHFARLSHPTVVTLYEFFNLCLSVGYGAV